MEFRCEDLPQFGLVLVPPTAPEYDGLLEDIQRRLDQPVAGSPPALPRRRSQILPEDRPLSAILLNRSPWPIASVQQMWTFEEVSGRTYSSSIGGVTGSSILLPFGLPESTLKLYGYWHVILPGSKRYFNSNGDEVGDNSDVRPPGPEEIWKGGIVSVGGGGSRRREASIKSVTFTLDGVFFADGGFAGPNRRGLWEQVVTRAEGSLRAAEAARRGHDDGLTPQQIFSEIEKVIGPPGTRPPIPPPPGGGWTLDDYRRLESESIAFQIARNREAMGDERTLYLILDWAQAPLPRFHRL